MAERRYIPEGAPFHVEPDGFKVWTGTMDGHFVVCDERSGATYRGDLAGVCRFIERIRAQRRR